MASFAGVSVVADGKLFATSAVDTGRDSGYHLLHVQGYSRANEAIPTGETISSNRFLVGGHQWYIDYYPNGDNPSSSDFISLHLALIMDEHVQQPVEARFDFSFVDQFELQNLLYIRATKIRSFSRNEGAGWGCSKFVRRDVLERSAHLKGDCFTIRCDILVSKDPNTKDAAVTMPDTGQHFNNLLPTMVGADVTFEVSGETFAAHRCVLAAKSTVFMAQLFGPMKEGTTSSTIHIKDMEAKVFKALLCFIYTGLFSYIKEDEAHVVEQGQEEKEVEFVMWLEDLLVAADIYDLQRLKLLCEENLSEYIGLSSVASTLALAEQHYCQGLKEACFKYIQVQSPPCLELIMATDGYDYIRTNYPSLMNEISVRLAVQDLK